VLAGNVDRMEFVSDNEIIVTDLKTGDAYESFDEVGLADYEKIKLHFYKYQLAFYSLLIENSRSYSKYKVRAGNLEFVESNKKGVIVVLPLSIDEEIKERLKRLIAVVCEKIHKLDFPDTTQYPNTFKGILQFEEDLLSGKA
jgi:phosphohistidine swiveling domain-containing protein